MQQIFRKSTEIKVLYGSIGLHWANVVLYLAIYVVE